MKHSSLAAALAAILVSTAAPLPAAKPAAASPGSPASPAIAAAVVAGNPPGATSGVADANAAAKDGQKVAVRGRLKDFVPGQATFTMVDSAVKSCVETGDNCPTPWDYCCTPKELLTANSATVKLVGAAGGKTALKGELKGVAGLDHLSTVTASGTARRDAKGNLLVMAETLYVK